MTPLSTDAHLPVLLLLSNICDGLCHASDMHLLQNHKQLNTLVIVAISTVTHVSHMHLHDYLTQHHT